MSHLYDRAYIAADTVISRVVDQYCNRIGILFNGLPDLVTAHAERDAQTAVNFRINVYRDRAAKDKRIDNASVHISRQDDLIAVLAA